VSSVAFNSITYTFNGPVTLPAATATFNPATLFGFGTSDGQTTFFGAGATATVSGNTVTVSFPQGDQVSNATYFFVRDGAVVGGIISDSGTQPSLRPNLLSVARVGNNPTQFVFTVDKPSNVLTASDFHVYRNAGTLLPYTATSVSPISSTQFLATFGPAGTPAGDGALSSSNTSSVVWGAIDWTNLSPAHAALLLASGPNSLSTPNAPGVANAVGGVAVSAISTALSNGPLLQSVSLSVGSGQGVFTFDRPIAIGSVVPSDFFVVQNNDTVFPGVSVVAVANNQVTIQFPAAGTGFVTANGIGGGLIGPFELQPGVNGGAGGTAATDSAGNPAVGTSVSASLVP
jgi:hypothetical protein